MIKATMNKRYKRLEYKGQQILIDMDTNKLTWFFPILVWFMPFEGYKISQNFLSQEIPAKKPQNNKIVVLGAAFSTVFIRMQRNGIGYVSPVVTVMLLLIVMIGIFSYRYFFRYQKNELSFEGPKLSVKLEFAKGLDWDYIRTILLAIIMIYTVLVLSMVTLITTNNVIYLLVIAICEYAILVFNTIIISPMTKNYTLVVEKLDENSLS